MQVKPSKVSHVPSTIMQMTADMPLLRKKTLVAGAQCRLLDYGVLYSFENRINYNSHVIMLVKLAAYDW
jgi:hypothetical protein